MGTDRRRVRLVVLGDERPNLLLLDACFLFLVALLSIRFLVNELVVSPHDTTC